MNTFGAGRPWAFSHFKKTNGYAAAPLDGVWLRAPYLHNGSVPTLRDLLNAPAERPTSFYRGYDVYDYINGGFIHQDPTRSAPASCSRPIRKATGTVVIHTAPPDRC